jgi:hypothetical protein
MSDDGTLNGKRVPDAEQAGVSLGKLLRSQRRERVRECARCGRRFSTRDGGKYCRTQCRLEAQAEQTRARREAGRLVEVGALRLYQRGDGALLLELPPDLLSLTPEEQQ